jgi:hypothetical protein
MLPAVALGDDWTAQGFRVFPSQTSSACHMSTGGALGSSQLACIAIKGATGTCRDQINGSYAVTGCDSSGYATYAKLGNAVCIERLGAQWQVKLAVDKGRNVCYACVQGDSKKHLEAGASRLWMVSVDGSTAVAHPGVIVEDLAAQAQSAAADLTAKVEALAKTKAATEAKQKADALAAEQAKYAYTLKLLERLQLQKYSHIFMCVHVAIRPRIFVLFLLWRFNSSDRSAAGRKKSLTKCSPRPPSTNSSPTLA